MNESATAIVFIVFIVGWGGLIFFVGRFLRAGGGIRRVWCPGMKCLSLVRTEPAPQSAQAAVAVRRCLLWPERHNCDQGCIQTAEKAS
jgi:hypothetical protein